MRVDDCYQLGEILKTHGLKGELMVHLDVDDPNEYREMESVFVQQDGNLVPFFIESISISDQSKAKIKFEDIDSVDDAKEMKGLLLFLPTSQLPELPDDQYYLHELIGFTVIADDESLGKVIEIFDQEPNPLFTVDANGKEVLIPLQDHFLKSVDKKNSTIVVNLPDGYLDLYLES